VTGCRALTRGRVSARPAFRVSRGGKGPLGRYESPLLEDFLLLQRSAGEPGVFIRRVQVHGPGVRGADGAGAGLLGRGFGHPGHSPRI
jgi:hypothetical protein